MMHKTAYTQLFNRLPAGIILLLGCLFVSCSSYRSFPVDVLKPAPITLGKGAYIGYWDRNIRCTADSSFILYHQEGVTPPELSFLFYQGVNAVWNQNREGDSLMALSGRYVSYVDRDTFPRPAPPSEIKRLCYTFGVDYLVTLEMFDYHLDMDLQKIYSNYYVRLYSRFSGLPIDSVIFREDLYPYLTEEYEYIDYIADQAWRNGTLYAERFTPSWKEVRRRVYNRQKVLRMGDIFFLNNNVEQAENLWKSATKLSPRVALQAYVNLAWMYENEGDFEQSRQMLQQALELARKHRIDNAVVTYIGEYLTTIEERIKEIDLIDQQLNESGSPEKG